MSGRRRIRATTLRAAVGAGLCGWLLLVAAVPARALLTGVDSADDICSPTADPCVINQTVQTVPGAVLDFGARALTITGAGVLDSGIGSLTVRSGPLTVSTSGTAIQVKGPDGFGGSLGGVAAFEVRRRCSGNTSLLCLRDNTCSNAGAGTCSVGSGNLSLGGKILGSADEPATVFLRAAGDVQILKTIACSGTSLESDGGTIEIIAGGSINVSDKLEATSTSLGGGGEISLLAGVDLTITDFLDATGGDFDGGVIDLAAGRDISIAQDVNANSTAGAGFGGEITLDAGRDIVINGGSGTNRLTVTSDGHQSAENFGGDGGPQDYFAGGNIHLGRFVRLSSDGAPPDGYGETVTLDAGGDILLEADIDVKGNGGFSGGGSLDAFATGDFDVTADSSITADGSDGGGGEVLLDAGGELSFGGSVSATGSGVAFSGAVTFSSDTTVSVSGSVLINGGISSVAGGELDVSACHISLLSGASIDNRLAGGINHFVAREQFTSGSGASVSAGSPGENRIEYRTSAKPPVVGGSFSPAPALGLRPTLAPCPICGNGQIEATETCDDGNGLGGDGCSSSCQNEGCIADTPGYPTVGLCDDGDQCSVDSCNNATSHCEHSSSCDDGISCTVDGCIGTTCTHTPNDTLCDDGSSCSDNVCNAVSGCVVVPLAGTCDDGLFCNGSDSCGGGSCSVHSGSPCVGLPECQDGCNESLDVCGSPFGIPCTSDGNLCTDNVCDGAGTCVAIPNSSPCDDGVFCNGSDLCSDGSCLIHSGIPCNPSRVCADVCDEAARTCTADAFKPCGDEGNACTDDYCDGSGSCIHEPNTGPCDDGDFCTTGDQCVDGMCVGVDGDQFTTSRLIVGIRPGVDDDSLLFKAEQSISTLSVLPSDVGMRLTVRDASGTPAYESAMPASAIVNVGGRGTTFKFKDTQNLIPAANKMSTVTVKRVEKKGTVRIKAKMKRGNVSGLTGTSSLSLSLLYGDGSGQSDCSTGRDLACVAKGAKLDCSR